MRLASLLVATVGCTPNAGVEYADPAGAFRFTYDQEWEMSLERGAVVVRPPKVEGSIAVSAAARSYGKIGRSIESVGPALLDQYASLEQHEVLINQRSAFRGRPSLALEVQFEHEGNLWRKSQVVVEGQSVMVYLDCNARDTEYDVFRSACRAVESSLVVEPEVAAH